MRCLVLVAMVLPVTAAAEDGYYVETSAGPVQLAGDLAGYAQDPVKVHIAFSARRGAWTYELITGGMFDQTTPYDRCGHQVACRTIDEGGRAWLDVLGGNVRYRWELVPSRWNRFGLWVSVYGGVRHYWGDGSLAAYEGNGVGAGTRVELDAWAIGYFFDVGMDALRLSDSAANALHATTPYVLFGGKVGWL